MPNRVRQSMIQHVMYENGIRIRAEFRLVGAKRFSDFCIQVETRKSEPIIRYDCKKHGFHRNLIYINGKKERPYPIQATNLEDFAINAIEDLKANLKQLLEKAGYQIELPFPINDTLDKQKEFLKIFVYNPSNIIDKKATNIMYKISEAYVKKQDKT